MEKWICSINRIVWGFPALALILGTGIYLTVKTRFVQIRLFPEAIRQFIGKLKGKRNSDSSYRALCTALAATIGTGNLVGVAGSIAIGGPGSIFWMWVCGILGMATKFTESALSVYYQQKNERGELVGGPMYMIEKGLGPSWKWLSCIYCFMGVAAAFGVGNATQVNAITNGIHRACDAMGFTYPRWGNLMIGIVVSIVILRIILKGAGKIGEMAEKFVPLASVAYLILSLCILIVQRHAIPGAFYKILNGAFHPKAITGGAVGSLFTVIRIGASRGVFTNEAGMGTASIAHGSARVRLPAEQGLMGIMEVFIDTIVICTITALIILTSGVPIPYGMDTGVTITSDAFSSVCGPWASIFVAVILCCFAFATILGWGLYGERCAQFLLGEQVWTRFAWMQAIAILLGAILQTKVVWMISETVNGLMAIPNLIALLLLSPQLVSILKLYENHMKMEKKL